MNKTWLKILVGSAATFRALYFSGILVSNGFLKAGKNSQKELMEHYARIISDNTYQTTLEISHIAPRHEMDGVAVRVRQNPMYMTAVNDNFELENKVAA